MTTTYLLGVIFVALILAFFFRQFIYMMWIRFMHGVYDTRYMVFSDNTVYYESPYYVKGELSDQVNSIKSAIISTEKVKTDKPLFFQNIKYGISTKELVALLGEPVSSSLVDMMDLKVVSMEYNLNLNNVIDKYVYYFYNDKYYLGEFIFNKVGSETSEQIVNNINSKYNTSFCSSNDFILANNSHNYLKYNDQRFYISVSYFNTKSSEVIQLINYLNEKTAKSKSIFDYQLNVNELSF